MTNETSHEYGYFTKDNRVIRDLPIAGDQLKQRKTVLTELTNYYMFLKKLIKVGLNVGYSSYNFSLSSNIDGPCNISANTIIRYCFPFFRTILLLYIETFFITVKLVITSIRSAQKSADLVFFY